MNQKSKKYLFLLFILLILSYLPINFIQNTIGNTLIANAAEKKAEKINTESKENEEARIAYQEFIDGKRKALIDINANILEDELNYNIIKLDELKNKEVSLQDILNMNFSTYEEKITFAEYAYLDCGIDGKEELAVCIAHVYPMEDMRDIFIIVYENEQLFIRYTYGFWTRSQRYLYYHGYIAGQGSAGANYPILSSYFLDSEGKMALCVKNNISFCVNDKYFEEIKKTFDKGEISVTEKIYTIQEKKYLCIEIENTENKSIDIKKCKEFCQLIEQNHGKLYSENEIYECFRQEREKRKIKKECMALNIPEWKIINHPAYSSFLKTMDEKNSLYNSYKNFYPDEEFPLDYYKDFIYQLSK